jgi:hypothetical protein
MIPPKESTRRIALGLAGPPARPIRRFRRWPANWFRHLPGLAGMAVGIGLMAAGYLTSRPEAPQRSHEEFVKRVSALPPRTASLPSGPAPEATIASNWDAENSVPIYGDRLWSYKTKNVEMELVRPFIPARNPTVRMRRRWSGEGGILVVDGEHAPAKIPGWRKKK